MDKQTASKRIKQNVSKNYFINQI